MTLKELEKRIDKIRGRPLVLLCRTPGGEERKMSVRECIETQSSFIHIDAGNSLDDLDRLLEYELAHIEVKETKNK